MALPDTLIARIIETVNEHQLSGDFLMLGRQRLIGTRRGVAAQLLKEVLEKYMPGVKEGDLKNLDDDFSENFFRILGFSTVNSMDISSFEGASIIQDLSGKLDPALKQRFDVIYDGGTCEHIFELPKAYRNLHRMLKPGGTLIGHSPCNNWINHSFYQISPEMIYGFWEKAMGYEVQHVYLQPLLPNFAKHVATTTNPNKTGKRPRIKGGLPKNSPLILNYAVRKPDGLFKESAKVYQSDYVAKWPDTPNR
ncbi:MAG: methyltransferase domain-containing protein [Rhodobacteraceae bacterium]|nr:methyltransferase domain-containing protein [Paracoccaceae bacterium]